MSFIATDLIPCITVLNISMITPPAPTTEESRASGKHSYNLASGVCMLPLCSMIITDHFAVMFQHIVISSDNPHCNES